MYNINASDMTVHDDGYATVIGFAENSLSSSKSVIIQKSHQYDEQDKKLGMDKVFIEVEDESRSHYGGIESIKLTNNLLTIELSKTAAAALQIVGNIEIAVNQNHPEFKNVVHKLGLIAKEERFEFIGLMGSDSID